MVIKGLVLILSHNIKQFTNLDIFRNQSINNQNWSPGVILERRCNLGQNMQILFKVLAQLPSSTTETKLGFYHQRWRVRVAPKATTRIKPLDLRKLGNFREVLKKLGIKRKSPAGQILEIALEICKKSPLKHHRNTNFCLISIIFA